MLLIADVRWSAAPLGLVWALAAAAMWAAYILLGSRVASGGNGIDDLAVGFIVAAVVLLPVLLLGVERPGALGEQPVVGQLVLGRLVVVVGRVALAQVPGSAEALGIAAVVGAVALRSRDGDPPSAGRVAPPTERDHVEDDVP